MDDDIGVRKVLEMVFRQEKKIIKGMSATASSIPSCVLTKEFPPSLTTVISTKEVIVIKRWQNLVDACCYKMFSSYETYLKYMMFVCRTEHGCNKNTFESFISICAVLILICDEIFTKTTMNLSLLNPDIVMVFYKSVMKKSFRKCGGLQKFVEYILSHRYLEINEPGIPITFNNPDKNRQMGLEIVKAQVYELVINADDIYVDYASGVLGNKCLGSISVDLPSLLSKPELVQNLVEYKRSQKAKTLSILKSELMGEISNPVIDSTTGCVEKGMDDFTQVCDDLIKAVVKHNQKNPDLKYSEESTLKKYNQSLKPETSAKRLKTETVLKSELKEKISNPVISSTTGCVAKEREELNVGYDEAMKAMGKHNQENPDLKISEEGTLKKYKQSQKAETSAKKLKTETDLKSELPKKMSNPVIDSTTGCVAKKMMDIAQDYNEIIKAVVKHNQKNSDLKISDESTLRKADEILEHLEDGIKSLIEVLDEQDKE